MVSRAEVLSVSLADADDDGKKSGRMIPYVDVTMLPFVSDIHRNRSMERMFPFFMSSSSPTCCSSVRTVVVCPRQFRAKRQKIFVFGSS